MYDLAVMQQKNREAVARHCAATGHPYPIGLDDLQSAETLRAVLDVLVVNDDHDDRIGKWRLAAFAGASCIVVPHARLKQLHTILANGLISNPEWDLGLVMCEKYPGTWVLSVWMRPSGVVPGKPGATHIAIGGYLVEVAPKEKS